MKRHETDYQVVVAARVTLPPLSTDECSQSSRTPSQEDMRGRCGEGAVEKDGA